MIKKWISLTTLFTLLALLLVGCSTIMNGTTQEIGFSSNPTGAKVCIDNQVCGKTPYVFKVSRKDNHIVRLEMEGYQPYETTLTRRVSGWVWGNIVFGGLIGLAVDAISGGIYKLTPEQIEGTLQQAQVSSLSDTNFLKIILVREPDPNWVKVAQLVPSGN